MYIDVDVDVDADAIEALPDFDNLSYEELVELIIELDAIVKKLSAELVHAQGRLAILRAERVRRLTMNQRGNGLMDLVDSFLARGPRKRLAGGNAQA